MSERTVENDLRLLINHARPLEGIVGRFTSEDVERLPDEDRDVLRYWCSRVGTMLENLATDCRRIDVGRTAPPSASGREDSDRG